MLYGFLGFVTVLRKSRKRPLWPNCGQSLRQPFDRGPHLGVREVRVTLRGLDVGMTEELGDGVERHPTLHQAAGKEGIRECTIVNAISALLSRV